MKKVLVIMTLILFPIGLLSFLWSMIKFEWYWGEMIFNDFLRKAE